MNADDYLQRDELWSVALEWLEREYSNPSFDMWLKPMRLVEFWPSDIVLSVHSNFARVWEGSRFKSDLTQLLSCLLGKAVDLRFIVGDNIKNAGSSPDVASCTIVTAPANDFMLPVHVRMPAILATSRADAWLAAESLAAADALDNPNPG